jgi:hypothetical protein
VNWSSLSSFDGSIAMPGFNPAHIESIEIVEPNSNADFWIDDISFM